MIQYSLKCEAGHRSDSWFKSAEAYDALARAGHLSCPVCGSGKVTKALMAPRVKTSEAAEEPAAHPMVTGIDPEIEKAIAALREKVEKTSDYVGDRFVAEARAIALGEKPERSIYGEARPDQARALIEEGVPVMPLPFRPKQKLT